MEEFRAIKNWYKQQKIYIDSTYDFPGQKPFEGDGFCVVFIPQIQYADKFYCDNCEPIQRVQSKKEIPIQSVQSTKAIPIWSLINPGDSTNGFIYKELTDSIFLPKESRRDFLPGEIRKDASFELRFENLLQFKVNKKKYFNDSTIDKIIVKYSPVIIWGEFKKLTIKNASHYKFFTYLTDNADRQYFNVSLLGEEVYYDRSSSKWIKYIFIPKKLNQKKEYKVYSIEQAHYSSLKSIPVTDITSMDKLEEDKKYPVLIRSNPGLPCKVYRIPQDVYDAIEEDLDKALKKSHYTVNEVILNYLEPKHILPDGPTDVDISSRQVNWHFLLRYGNKISPPLECKPGPGEPKVVKWLFD